MNEPANGQEEDRNAITNRPRDTVYRDDCFRTGSDREGGGSMVRRLGALTAIVAMLISMMGVAAVGAYHEDDGAIHPWADPRFEARWARADLPVSTGAAVRTWIWGPSPYTPGMWEPYVEAPGGERLVQYTDKSRMELNDPDSADNSLWVVTQGLLAAEMLHGRIQVGHDAFVDHSEGASTENVAGDPGPDNGPTYATMAGLMDASARAEGTVIDQYLALDGTITTDAALAAYGVTAAERVTVVGIDHTIASVFWDFMMSQGVIWDGNAYTTGYLFAEESGEAQPFYAVGYPLTEAYWSQVRVGGTQKNVLVQCFERRCLTFTPDNPVGWQVEAGNVGQHYYRWLQEHVEIPPYDVLAEGLIQPRGAHVGPDGTVYVAEAGMGGDNCVTVGEGDEEMEVCGGFTGRVSTWTAAGGFSVLADDLPSLSLGDEGVGPQDVYVTADGRVFVVIGLGADPAARAAFGDVGEYLGWILEIDPSDGSWEAVADVAIHESIENPDGDHVDSNPYSLVVVEDGFVVSDAGANALIWVSEDGIVTETLAVFPTQMAPAPPFLGLPPGAEIPMESVPTGMVIGPDGNYYVGELTGFPFQQGGARVWQVTPEGAATVYVDGFTNIIDVAFDDDGDLLVLEIVAASLLGAEQDPRGRLVHVDADTMAHTVLLHNGLVFPAGMAVGDDNMIYMTNFGVMPNAALIAFESPLP